MRANNTKLKLLSINFKMKLDSNNIKMKLNTVILEQSNKIKVIPGILEPLQSNLLAKIETIFDKKF